MIHRVNEWRVYSRTDEVAVYVVACNRQHAVEHVGASKFKDFFTVVAKIGDVTKYTNGSMLSPAAKCKWCGRENVEKN